MQTRPTEHTGTHTGSNLGGTGAATLRTRSTSGGKSPRPRTLPAFGPDFDPRDVTVVVWIALLGFVCGLCFLTWYVRQEPTRVYIQHTSCFPDSWSL
jgi:hypothetical protein